MRYNNDKNNFLSCVQLMPVTEVLMIPRNSPEALAALTEPSRLECFINSDQHEWTQQSIRVTDEISKLLAANKSLYEIYEYARIERHNIAIQLKHMNKGAANEFGVIRDSLGKQHCDIYNNDTFASTHNRHAEILFNQILIVLSKSKDQFFYKTELDSTGYAWKHGENAAKKYELHTNESTALQEEMHLEIVIAKRKKRDNIIEVRAYWGAMNVGLYKKKLGDLQALVSLINNCDNLSKTALYYIALLAWNMSRDMYVTRGSAAINSWILRALAKKKGFSLELITINNLSFDVYAEIESNPVQYANNFVYEIGKKYKLFINPEIENKIDAIQERIAHIIKSYQKHGLPGQRGRLFGGPPDHAEQADQLLTQLSSKRDEYLTSEDRCQHLANHLAPFVNHPPKGGNNLRLALLPLYNELSDQIIAVRRDLTLHRT